MIMTQSAAFRLEYSLDAFVRIGIWVASRGTDSNPDTAANGPILPKCEIDALGIPIESILRQLAGETVVDKQPARELTYWNGGVRRAAFAKDGERPVHFAPGEAVPEGDPHHIELTPELCYMPLSDNIAAIELLAYNHGIPPDEFLFKWRGVRITDADMLFRMVRMRPDDAGALVDALQQWRDQCIARIAQVRADAGEEYTVPVPAWVRNARLPRQELAENMGLSLYTLYRWDRHGHASFGFAWIKGRRVSGNLVLINIEANWPTIEGIILRESRKTAVVRREKIKKSVEAFMYSQNPVLDEVIANEERARREDECQVN